MSDASDDQGKQLFDQEFAEDEKKSYNEDDVSRQEKPIKRLKKNKKDKKDKKKRHRYEQQDDSENQRGEMDSMFEDEASQGSDEEQDPDEEAQLGYYEEKKKFEQLYARKENGSDAILKRIAGKSEKEINQMYKRKLHQRRQNQVLFPSSEDHQTYSVQCKMGKEDQVVFSILKKTQHYNKTKSDKFKIEITSAMAMKKKYPGKIFVEAQDEKTIRQGLQGLIDVNIKRIIKLEHEDYTNLFMVKEVEQAQFRENSYIRIKKGVYEDDLGKIVKLKKNNADVLLVPRVNVQEILIKIKEFTSKMTDEKAIQEKTQEILRRFVNPRTHYPQNMRPAKKFFDNEDPFGDIDVPFASRIHIQKGGLIVLNFRLDELKKIQQGSVLPAEMAPFAQNGQTFEQMKQEKVATVINFEKGQQAEIIAGQLAGYFGTVEQIKANTAVIKCRAKGMEGQLLEEPFDHLAKRFKQGERVKVNSGADKGKTGIILKLDGKYADIWTDNQNTIKINKNNLQLYMGEIINQENVHNLRKDDLIKTSKNVVGIVLSTTKDNIKILDMNNTIQIVNNLDFDSKINSGLLLTKNKSNEQIRNNSIIRIRQGIHEGLRCVVKHVYKDFVFLFNEQLDKTSGITVEKADNCAVLAKTSEGMKKFTQKSNIKPGFNQRDGGQEDQFKVGKSIVISSGPLKGYRGVIKSINKDRIEVRVPQKSATQWITRSNLVSSSNRDRMEMGKTPSRMAMSTHQVAGMSPAYNYN